jgi:hypothetical protein
MRISPGDQDSLNDFLDARVIGEAGDGDDRLDAESVQAIVMSELTEAVSFIDTEVSRLRAEATAAYQGQPYGDEQEGQSKVVSMDVRDSVLGLLPDLLRIYTSGENVVEYEPENAQTVNMAEAATDYANYVFNRDNDGFNVLHSCFKDALIRKAGFAKFWWDHQERVVTEHYSGLDPMAVFVLENDPDVEEIRTTELQGDSNTVLDPFTGKPAPLVDALVKRRTKRGRIRVVPLPPEEFLIDRRARSLEPGQFTVVAHRSMKTVSELVALGYDADEVADQVTSTELDYQIEVVVRQPFSMTLGGVGGSLPNSRVLYTEAYMHLDLDHDGIAELVRICTVGASHKIIDIEPTDHVPFAVFLCDPEPHTFFGLSVYDVTHDIQRIKTHVWRNSLDSLAQSIHPRMAAVEGQVNFDDLLNNEVGSVIRMRQAGAVQQLDTAFVGQAAFPMLDYIDDVREMRTGVSKASMGLDPSIMQSTTSQAVSNTISQSQGRVELVARVLADGMRQLFRGILHLIVKNQDRARMIMLRGQWVEMDPRTWVADLNVRVNIALGAGSKESKIATLQMIAGKQEQIMMQLGPNNPLVKLSQYATTLKRMAELAGFRDSSAFFSDVPPNWQPPQNPPPPNPQLIAAQAQQQNAQTQQQKVQLDAQKAAQANQRDMQANAADVALRAAELHMKYGGQVQGAAIDAMNEQAENQLDRQHQMQMQQQQQQAQQAQQQSTQAAQAQQAAMQQRAQFAQAALEQAHETHRNAVNAGQQHAAAMMENATAQQQAQAQQAQAAAAKSNQPSNGS